VGDGGTWGLVAFEGKVGAAWDSEMRR